MVHTINPDLVDFDQCRKQNARTNLEQAFSVAEYKNIHYKINSIQSIISLNTDLQQKEDWVFLALIQRSIATFFCLLVLKKYYFLHFSKLNNE
jgi:hypothetical protein